LSGYGMDEDLRCSREAGFSKHLIKPIDFAQLDQALEELMSDKETEVSV
jgi:CheY-like chemotaxis protein